MAKFFFYSNFSCMRTTFSSYLMSPNA